VAKIVVDNIAPSLTVNDRRVEVVTENPCLSDIPSIASRIVNELDGSLQFIFAVDENGKDAGEGGANVKAKNRFALHHVFCIPSINRIMRVVSRVPAGTPEFPSLASDYPVANWHERKISDLLGLKPVGHPDTRRLIMHEDWPDDTYLLRNDFDRNGSIPRVEGKYEFVKVEGEGVFEIAVGPVHAGIIEPGHFRFSSVGERIIYLELRMFYKHRAVELLMKGKTLLHGTLLSERISGDESVANSTAFCHAVENVYELAIPLRAQCIRAILLELERIHCHLADIAGAATDVAFPVGASNALILREKVLSLCESITGSRFMRGMVIPGGLRRDIDASSFAELLETMEEIGCSLSELESSLFSRSSVVDRFAGTGKLETKHATDLGTVGPVARSSDIRIDSRVDFPYGYYALKQLDVITKNDGDVSARVRLKFDEIRQSLAIIHSAVEDLNAMLLENRCICADLDTVGRNTGMCDADSSVNMHGSANAGAGYYMDAVKSPDSGTCVKNGAAVAAGVSAGSALGWVEAPRGQTLCWVELDGNRVISDCRWRTPSFNNWPALPYALSGDIVPDFPLVNKSFNLSYAGTDL
jgi:Ni,Fe-hydrogenase III large subunit/Ni,Fe-hydrogenase III component G